MSLEVVSRSERLQTLLIAIPAVGLSHPEDWKWMFELPQSIAPGLGVLLYRHGLAGTQNFSWASLLGQSLDLRNRIEEFIQREKLYHCPVLLVAHSLGGILAKEALADIFKSSSDYKHFVRSFAGLVLMGTPHSKTEDAESWNNAAFILQLANSSIKRRQLAAEGVKILPESCKKFEQAAISRPILSIYEMQETKVRTNMVSTKKVQLTSLHFVRTGLPNEELLGFSTDHSRLCSPDATSEDYKNLRYFVQTALEDARLRIVRGSQEIQIPPGMDDWTMRDDESQSYGLSRELEMTNISSSGPAGSDTLDATAGSSDMGFELVPTPGTLFTPENQQRSPEFPCHMISIARNKEFFGREDILETLRDAFLHRHPSANRENMDELDGVTTFAITGLGGMGKTQIVAEFVHSQDVKKEFNAIFWINADSVSRIAEGFREIALRLHLVAEDSVDLRDPIVVRELVKGWLANPVMDSASLDDTSNQANWLIIFDNTDDVEVLEDYWPIPGRGCVLFTSRDPVAKDSTYLATEGIKLEPLSVEAGAQLLRKLTKKSGDATEVSRVLGGHPLAIAQMASIIIRRDLTFDEFCHTYREEQNRKELFESRLDRRRRESGHTIATVWTLENLNHGAVLLDVLSFLDPDGIQEHIMTKSPKVTQLDSFPTTVLAYQKARAELLQSSLITRNVSGQSLIIHRLIQDAARSKMSDDYYRLIFDAAISLVSEVWPFEKFDYRHTVARWRVCEGLFPHIRRLKQFAASFKVSLQRQKEDFMVAKLLTDAGWYLHESGGSAEAKSFFETARDIAEPLIKLMVSPEPTLQHAEVLANEVNATLAEIHHNLGCVATETNEPLLALTNFEAFNAMMKLEIDDERAKKDPRLGISFNELGNAFMLNNRWEEGKSCFLTAIECTKRMVEYSKTDYSLPMVNLGLSFWFTSDFKEAESVLSEALEDRKIAFGQDDNTSFITGRLLHALGNVKASQNDTESSFAFHKRALKQYKSTIGKRHHRTGDVHVKLAEHYRRMEDPEEAMGHVDSALKIFKLKPVFKPETTRAAFKRSLILDDDGQTEEAKLTREQSIKWYRDITGQENAQPNETDFDEMVAFWSR